jgi:hypothetical protein
MCGWAVAGRPAVRGTTGHRIIGYLMVAAIDLYRATGRANAQYRLWAAAALKCRAPTVWRGHWELAPCAVDAPLPSQLLRQDSLCQRIEMAHRVVTFAVVTLAAHDYIRCQRSLLA